MGIVPLVGVRCCDQVTKRDIAVTYPKCLAESRNRAVGFRYTDRPLAARINFCSADKKERENSDGLRQSLAVLRQRPPARAARLS